MRGSVPLILLLFVVRLKPSFTVGLPPVLEGEPDGRLDAAVAGVRAAAAEAEAADGEERLPELIRAEVTHGLAEVRPVEQVDEVEREVQRVALPFRAARRAHHDHHAAAEAGRHLRGAATARRPAARVAPAAVVRRAVAAA